MGGAADRESAEESERGKREGKKKTVSKKQSQLSLTRSSSQQRKKKSALSPSLKIEAAMQRPQHESDVPAVSTIASGKPVTAAEGAVTPTAVLVPASAMTTPPTPAAASFSEATPRAHPASCSSSKRARRPASSTR